MYKLTTSINLYLLSANVVNKIAPWFVTALSYIQHQCDWLKERNLPLKISILSLKKIQDKRFNGKILVN